MEKRWHILSPPPAAVAALVEALGCHPVVATLLANRGLVTPERAQAFLNPSLSRLRPPTALKDLEPAVRRIARAVTAGERILLFGDYDVDGATATAVLYEFLTACGAEVSYYIPHRLKEGYGLQARHIAEVAVPRRAALLITLDCGITSHAAVAAAAAAGIDVIVTDHHAVGDRLPAALAVVNPQRADCTAGLKPLAGVGVAFCVAIALRTHLREIGFWRGRAEPNLRSLCDLVALGTIADMAPLRGENRILARAGLELIGAGRRPGLAALMEAAGLGRRPAEAEDVAFRLGPRLNAAGRLDHAALAVELLTTGRPEAARDLAQTLTRLNGDRQEIERGILAEVRDALARQPELLEGRSLVLAGPDWHEGVIGIVASRVMEMVYRPVVLIALKDGRGRGSARSIPGIDLLGCLAACRRHLRDLGGHTQAAGLQLEADRLPEFRRAFEAAVRAAADPALFVPTVTVDGELDVAEISDGLADQIEALAPFGTGNPEPLFMARDVVVVSAGRAGRHHERLVLRSAGGPADRCFRAIRFFAEGQAAAGDRIDRLLYRLRWNRWNGAKTLQLVVEATAPARPA